MKNKESYVDQRIGFKCHLDQVQLKLDNHSEIVIDNTVWSSKMDKTISTLRTEMTFEQDKSMDDLVGKAKKVCQELELKLKNLEADTQRG